MADATQLIRDEVRNKGNRRNLIDRLTALALRKNAAQGNTDAMKAADRESVQTAMEHQR